MMFIPNTSWNVATLTIVAVIVQLRTAIAATPMFVKVDSLNVTTGRGRVDLSADGTMMIVGNASPFDVNTAANATVYQRTVGTNKTMGAWKQVGPVIQSSGLDRTYAINVAMSSLDGTVVAVCGSQNVDVYKLNRLSTKKWEKVGATLVSDVGGELISMDLSADGSTIVIGRTAETVSGEVTVYKFSLSSNQWELVGRPLTGIDQYEYFGDDVAISSDGSTIAVTSYNWDFCSDVYPNDSRVEVYNFDLSTSEWKQVGSDIGNNFLLGSDDFFLTSAISLSGDGSTLILGAVENFFNGYPSGKAMAYKFDTLSNQWKNIFYISGEEPLDKLGSVVDISSDGTVLAIGSRSDDDGQVRVYAYQFSNTTEKYEKIFPNVQYCEENNDAEPCLFAGSAMALSGDGKTLVYGTYTRAFDISGSFYDVNSIVSYKSVNGTVSSPTKPPSRAPTMSPTKSPLPPSNRNYFTVIDAKTDTAIGLLKSLIPGRPSTIDYSMLNTSSISIGSIFTSSNTSVIRSVQLTLDNPKRTVCQRRVPYTLFGGTRGDVFGEPFILGRRLVTASAYNGTNCDGSRVGALSQSFDVKGCKKVQYKLFDAKRDTFVSDLLNTTTISNPPCNVSIGVTFQCGFQPDSVVFKLQSTTSKSVPILMRTEKQAPYYLFGDNGRGNIHPGTIKDGKYSLNIEIDGIIHPSIQFSLVNACRV